MNQGAPGRRYREPPRHLRGTFELSSADPNAQEGEHDTCKSSGRARGRGGDPEPSPSSPHRKWSSAMALTSALAARTDASLELSMASKTSRAVSKPSSLSRARAASEAAASSAASAA